MPRAARIAPGGMVFHVLNRANAGAEIFRKEEDYGTRRGSDRRPPGPPLRRRWLAGEDGEETGP